MIHVPKIIITFLVMAAPARAMTSDLPSAKAPASSCEEVLASGDPAELAKVFGADDSSFFMQHPEAFHILFKAAQLMRTPLAGYPDPKSPMLRVEALVSNLRRQAARFDELLAAKNPELNPIDNKTVEFARSLQKRIGNWADGFQRNLNSVNGEMGPIPNFFEGLNLFRLAYLSRAYQQLIIGFLPRVNVDTQTAIADTSYSTVTFDNNRAMATLHTMPFGNEPEFGWKYSVLIDRVQQMRRGLNVRFETRPRLVFIAVTPIPEKLKTELAKHYDRIVEATALRPRPPANGAK